ncbi:hypothetical protein, partial [Mesorhizobium sp. M0323]|uniref:hypothetical protein n=1 Tax=Mesorhizobium sp. M0323 TaxID=2956938 RepID=UPI0033370501
HKVSTYFGGHLMHQSTQQQKVRGNSRLRYGNQLTKLKKLSEKASEYADNGIMMFPGQVFERVWSLGADEDTPDAKQLVVSGVADLLVGVISYRTMFDDKIHQTAFVYLISVGDGDVVTFSPWAGGYAT